MIFNSNFRLYNQTIDLKLGPIEDENLLKEIKAIFRKTLFESGAFLLNESKERLVGIYADGEGAGTSLYEQDGFWFINVGFSEMSPVHIDEMISYFEPLEKTLKGLKGDLFLNLVYVLENQNPKEKAENGFLKELVLVLPPSLIDDGIRRIFKLRHHQENIAYTFTSLHEGVVSIKEGIALLQKERMNAEKLFISSLHCWLSSIKHPESIKDPNIQIIKFPNFVPKNNLAH